MWAGGDLTPSSTRFTSFSFAKGGPLGVPTGSRFLIVFFSRTRIASCRSRERLASSELIGSILQLPSLRHVRRRAPESLPEPQVHAPAAGSAGSSPRLEARARRQAKPSEALSRFPALACTQELANVAQRFCVSFRHG